MSNPLVRLLSVGDVHADVTTPSSRKDNYWATVRQKLEEVKQIAIDRKISKVVVKGDLFNKKEASRVPYHVTNWLIGYFTDCASSGITVFLTMGNHDINTNPWLWDRQPIGTIIRNASVYPLWSDEQLAGGTKSYRLGDTIVLCGRVYDYALDKEGNRRAYYGFKREKKDDFVIASVHGELLPNGKKFIADFSTPVDLEREIPDGELADLYLCGHVHDDMGLFRGEKILCENRGALTRGSIDEYNLRRTVQVTIITVNADRTVEAEAIPLKSAKDSDEVFYVSELKQQRKHDAHIAFLTEMLSEQSLLDTFSVVSPDAALQMLTKTRGTSRSVISRVEGYLKMARQRLGM